MGKFSNRPTDDNTPREGVCKICNTDHSYSKWCAVPDCRAPGTMTHSTTHACSGSVHWYCREHFFGTDRPAQPRDIGISVAEYINRALAKRGEVSDEPV